jgi:IMP cyclohydrolase
LKTELIATFRTAAEVFANVFVRKDREGLYAGTIYSYDRYSAIDNKTQQKEDFTEQYLVLRAGFRWFPF